MANGQPSTITSYADAAGATGATGTAAASASSTSATPGLQSGAAHATRGYAKEVVALIGGAVGVAYLL